MSQKAAKDAEKNADPLAEKATKRAGKAAEDATKKVHETKDEVDLPKKVDQATERAAKEAKEAPEKAGSAAGSAAKKVHTYCNFPAKQFSCPLVDAYFDPCRMFLFLVCHESGYSFVWMSDLWYFLHDKQRKDNDRDSLQVGTSLMLSET